MSIETSTKSTTLTPIKNTQIHHHNNIHNYHGNGTLNSEINNLISQKQKSSKISNNQKIPSSMQSNILFSADENKLNTRAIELDTRNDIKPVRNFFSRIKHGFYSNFI